MYKNVKPEKSNIQVFVGADRPHCFQSFVYVVTTGDILYSTDMYDMFTYLSLYKMLYENIIQPQSFLLFPMTSIILNEAKTENEVWIAQYWVGGGGIR